MDIALTGFGRSLRSLLQDGMRPHHAPVIACGSYFPGQKVITIRPNSDPAVTTAICKACDMNVLVENYSHMDSVPRKDS
jgi:hypothetical protein